MLTLILATMLTAAQTKPAETAQFKPCVWPNTCASKPVAQFQPCVWPNRCATTAAAQFQPCVWPNKCS